MEKIKQRKEILESLVSAFEAKDYINGMWQCGSAAFDRVDDWSDIDIVVDVEDEYVDQVFEIADQVLEGISPLEETFGSFKTPWPGVYQKAYRLTEIDRFLIIEIAVVQTSSSHKFLEKEIHGDVVVHFDKKNVTDVAPIDPEKFEEQLQNRVVLLKKKFNIYHEFLVEKELNRDNYIEAFAFYYNFTLNPLLELLRIKYNPYRSTFGTRYVYYDLPEEIVNRLEPYYFVKDAADLKQKHQEVAAWFKELVQEF